MEFSDHTTGSSDEAFDESDVERLDEEIRQLFQVAEKDLKPGGPPVNRPLIREAISESGGPGAKGVVCSMVREFKDWWQAWGEEVRAATERQQKRD